VVKILEACPFFCENLVASIKAENSAGIVDELHVVESDRTFQNSPKEYVFDAFAPHVRYAKLDGIRLFTSSPWRLCRTPPFLMRSNPAWKNEATQRNLAADLLRKRVSDDDVVVFSDIDEIIDWRQRDLLLDAVRRHGIVTIRLHVTVFFANLFSLDEGGPPGYSYRVFLMRGKEFKRLGISSDTLRKRGEAGRLNGQIHCLDQTLGFHHSWLGDSDFILRKLNAYSHSKNEHDSSLLRDDQYSIERIQEALQQRKSLFAGHLEAQPHIALLPAVERQRAIHPEMFLPDA